MPVLIKDIDFSKFEKVVFVNTGDVLDGQFLHKEFSEKEGLPGQAKKAIQKEDILFSEIRPINKRFAFVEKDCDEYVVSTKFMVLRSKGDVIPKYLYHYLKCSSTIRNLQKEAESRSGTFPQITFDAVSYFSIPVPSKEQQKRISTFVDKIEEKIELNQKMNQTLEEIAKTLFKSWFIDFDPVRAKAEGRPTGLSKEISDLFPDSFEDSELGDIPKDWKVESIESLSSKIAMGPFGSDMKTSTYVEEGVPIISGKQMSGYLLKDEDNNFISPSHAQKLKNSLVQRGDTVITQTGTVGQVSLIPQNSKYSQYIHRILRK